MTDKKCKDCWIGFDVEMGPGDVYPHIDKYYGKLSERSRMNFDIILEYCPNCGNRNSEL